MGLSCVVSAGVTDGSCDEAGVDGVQPGDGISQVEGDAVGKAASDAEQLTFTARAREQTGVEGVQRSCP
jgi:hypothetical protein